MQRDIHSATAYRRVIAILFHAEAYFGEACASCPRPGKIFFGQLLCKIRAFSGKNHVKLGNFVNFSGEYHKN